MDPNETPISVADNPIPNMPSPVTSPLPPITPPAKKSRLVPLLLLIGLVILIAIPLVYFTRPKPKAPPTTQAPVAIPTPVALFLKINSPEPSVTVVNGEMIVSGQTLPTATVVAYSDIDDVILEPNSQGNFEGTVIVGESGGNLSVTAYAETGEETTQTFTIQPTLTTNSFGFPVLAAMEIARSDNAPEKPAEERAPNLNALKTQNLITPTPKLNQSEQVKIKAFVAAKNQASKLPKLGPNKLKDLVSAPSTPSGQSKDKKPGKTATESAQIKLKPMHAKTATAGAVLKRRAISGVITNLEDGVITLTHPIQRDRVTTIYTNANTIVTSKGNTITTPSGLTIGMRIAVVGEPVDNALLASRVHVIPGKAIGVFAKNPVASPSAKLSLTPTATPSITITATPSATPIITITPLPSPTPPPPTPTP